MTITIHIPPLRHAFWGYLLAASIMAGLYATTTVWGGDGKGWDVVSCSTFMAAFLLAAEAGARFATYQTHRP